MKAKKILIIAVLSVCSYGASAQFSLDTEEDNFPQVLVQDSENGAGLASDEFQFFHSQVLAGVSACNRIVMIDKNTITQVNENAVFDQLSTAGIDYVLIAKALTRSCQRVVPDANKNTGVLGVLDALVGPSVPHWSAKISYSIDIVSVKSKKKVFSKSYEANGTTAKEEEKENVAYANAMEKISSNVRLVCNAIAPLDGKILKVEEANAKKTKVETVIIDLGERLGLSAGDQGTVYIKVDIAGETSMKSLGSATVESVLSANRSICKINKGKESVAKSITDDEEVFIRF